MTKESTIRKYRIVQKGILKQLERIKEIYTVAELFDIVGEGFGTLIFCNRNQFI